MIIDDLSPLTLVDPGHAKITFERHLPKGTLEYELSIEIETEFEIEIIKLDRAQIELLKNYLDCPPRFFQNKK